MERPTLCLENYMGLSLACIIDNSVSYLTLSTLVLARL